ncbi:hypothetical protein K8R04_01725 [Candidatus Uhrbacteria bacterium]|nr:hypothetical protein [Candidatus Uhrbacteria bacterium]
MSLAQRQTFEDDPVFEETDMKDVVAAYNCGLKNLKFLGIWTEGTNLAYMRGRSARNGYPIIDFPDAPPLTSQVLLHA